MLRDNGGTRPVDAAVRFERVHLAGHHRGFAGPGVLPRDGRIESQEVGLRVGDIQWT